MHRDAIAEQRPGVFRALLPPSFAYLSGFGCRATYDTLERPWLTLLYRLLRPTNAFSAN